MSLDYQAISIKIIKELLHKLRFLTDSYARDKKESIHQ